MRTNAKLPLIAVIWMSVFVVLLNFTVIGVSATKVGEETAKATRASRPSSSFMEATATASQASGTSKVTRRETIAAAAATTASPQSMLLCHVSMTCVSGGAIAKTSSSTQANGHHNDHKDHDYFECNPVIATDEDNDDDVFISDFSAVLDLPKEFVRTHYNHILAGDFFIQIAGGRIVNGHVVYENLNDNKDGDDDDNDGKSSSSPTSLSSITVAEPPMALKTRRGRHLDVVTTGTRKLLVLRVISNDASPYFSNDQLHDLTFDKSAPFTKPSVSSQYAAISFGKLNFVPAVLPNNGGTRGVLDVHVNMNSNGADADTIRDAAIQVVQNRFGVSTITTLADHVMVCIPPGTGTWAAVSNAPGWRSVYNDKWCGFLSATMHELGHNLGLSHSNMNGIAYGDFSSYMSAGYGTTYYPMKSFNGQNHWQLGWYNDRLLVLDPSSRRRRTTTAGRMIFIATFVDYNKSNKAHPVLVMVGNNTVMQYNRAKGFNAETQTGIDQVTIVRKDVTGTVYLGGLDANNPAMSLTDVDGTGHTLYMYYCGVVPGSDTNPDLMAISVVFDDANANFCIVQGNMAPVPTRRPTVVPRRRRPRPPTVRPTRRPRPRSATTTAPVGRRLRRHLRTN